jgi:hypothetical protein
MRFVWPAYKGLPIERSVWQLGFFWIGVLLDVVFANVPLQRLVASDIKSQPGSLTALIVIIVIVIVIVINQLRIIRKTGYLPKYLTLYVTGGVIVGLVAAIPGEELRLHHWVIAAVLLPGCAWPTRLSLIYSAFLLGMYLNGSGRWGMDGLVEDVATVRGDATIGSDLPIFSSTAANWTGVAANSVDSTTVASGTVAWDPIPDSLQDSWDSFALLVDDVLRYQGTDTNYNLSSLFGSYYSDVQHGYTNYASNATLDALAQQLASEPHYLRLAYVSSGQYGDFTRAAIAYYNGTWIDAPPGAT